MDRVPSVSFGIARIATCRGCPEAFQGWTGCHPSVSESLELQFEGWTGCRPSVSESLELQLAAAAQKVLRGGEGAVRQFRNR